MYVMDRLWQGEISPAERRIRLGSEYQRTAHEVCQKIEAFRATLTPEAREQLEVIGDLKSDINMMENEDFFLYGFRLGAGLVLDIVGGCEGQFCDTTEAG